MPSQIDARTLLADPRIYAANWLNEEGVEVKGHGLKCPKKRRRDQIEDTMRLDYISQLAAFNATQEPRARISGIKETDMTKAVNEAIERAATAERMEQLAKLTFDASLEQAGNEQLAVWVTAVEAEPSQLTMNVMKHWVWMVKRKLADLPVVYHVMPILVGQGQGSGKSTAVRRLYSPLQQFALDIKADFFSDDRNTFAFATNFVGFLDELASLNRSAVEHVKRIITADTLSARRLRTNDVYTIEQNCSFIGTSNISVGLIVNDTAMRRFYEITAASSLDWDAINTADYLTIFKSIDESRADGYIADSLEELRIKQSELATPEPVAMFLDDRGLKPGKEKQIKVADLYAKYRIWCEDNGNSPLNNAWFSKRVKALGFEHHRSSNNRFFWLSESSQLGQLAEYPQPATVHKIGGDK